jgi:hypothetical protein
MADLEQKRRTVRVLELLTESFEAHQRGDDQAFRAALDAATECDAFALAGIRAGITIGEIPNPERDWPLWVEYVAVNREGLAAMEAEEDGTDEGSGNGPAR